MAPDSRTCLCEILVRGRVRYPRSVILRYLPLLGSAHEAFVILVAAFGASMLVGLIFHAGPASNLVAAALAALPIRLGLVPFLTAFDSIFPRVFAPDDLVGLFLGTVVLLNVLLAVFNLLPI